MFSFLPKTNLKFSVSVTLWSANAFNLDWSKILQYGKELKNSDLWKQSGRKKMPVYPFLTVDKARFCYQFRWKLTAHNTQSDPWTTLSTLLFKIISELVLYIAVFGQDFSSFASGQVYSSVVWQRVNPRSQTEMFNPLSNDNILDMIKFKAFADAQINVAQNLKFVYERVENIVGKWENAGNQHFLLFPQCFQKSFSVGVVRSWLCGKELTLFQTSPGFYVSAVQVYWKQCGKRRNCLQWAISAFPSVFYLLWTTVCHFCQIWNCHLQTLLVWKSLKLSEK